MRNLKRENVEMNRRAIVVITSILIFLLASLAFAQSSPDQNPPDQNPPSQPVPPPPVPAPAPVPVPTVQVFGGYSLLHESLNNLNGTDLDADLHIYPKTFSPRTNFNGWNAEAQYNFSRWIGGVFDASGYTGEPFAGTGGVSGVPKMNSYTFLAGPVVSYRGYKRATPYIHALFGWNRTNLSASTLTGVPSPVSNVAETYTDFTESFGGGLDYKLTRRVAFRVGELDWFRTTLNLNSFYASAFANTFIRGFETKEGNIRFSTGIVVNFSPGK
jgi:opacity protein-like surface antigen